MEDDVVRSLQSKDESRIVTCLEKFVNENEKSFTFPKLDQTKSRRLVWTLLISTLQEKRSDTIDLLCLKAIRILSRDKRDLHEILNEETIDVLLEKARLKRGCRDLENTNPNCVFEAQKCLFNLIFNSVKGQQLAGETDLNEGILHRLEFHADPRLTHSIKFFDLRILAVLLCLNGDCRPVVRFTLNAIPRLVKLIKNMGPDNMPDEDVDLCTEALTAIYALLLSREPPKIAEATELRDCETWEEGEETDLELVSMARTFLSAKVQSETKKEELRSKIVDLLNNINPRHYDAMVPNGDFSALDSVLELLDSRLDKVNGNLRDLLISVLNFLRDACLNHRGIRRYVRFRVLPPLRDASQRPEVGTSLRNKLCKLMTSVNLEAAAMVAEFLFVLCKENVPRLIKYTGFGNAAGLLAHKGLLAGQKQSPNPNYSDESEDSDTEEYEKIRDKVNPVLGCCEAPHPDPTEGMTEEQKEYEAVKLVNLMDRLHRMGVVQPARIGEDGKPCPVEHVLELQQSMPNNVPRNDNDSDEDY